MKLDFINIEKILNRDGSMLVDETNIKDDLDVMYKYYSNSNDEDIPDDIKDYLKSHDDLDFKLFARAYIKSVIQMDVDLERTYDGWIRILKLI